MQAIKLYRTVGDTEIPIFNASSLVGGHAGAQLSAAAERATMKPAASISNENMHLAKFSS